MRNLRKEAVIGLRKKVSISCYRELPIALHGVNRMNYLQNHLSPLRTPVEQWPVERVRELIRPLSARQLHILQALAAGESNAEIGIRLGISEKAVEKRISKLYIALGVPRRIEAVVIFTIYDVSRHLDSSGS